MKRWLRRRVDGGADHTAAVAHRVRSLISTTDLVDSDDPDEIRKRLNGGRSKLAGAATQEASGA